MIDYNGVLVSEKKYNELSYLVELLTAVPCVTQLILFGSVLTDDCTEESDIDLIVVGTKPRVAGFMSIGKAISNFYSKYLSCDLDVFYYKEGSKELLSALSKGHMAEEGKVIWKV